MGDTTLSRPAFYQYFKDLHELIEASKEICFETAAGPTERTNKDRELQEVGFTDAANYGVPQVCSLPRSH